jgi:hypothetical protein
MRLHFLLTGGLCLTLGSSIESAANPINTSPAIAYSDGAVQELWNAVVAQHHASNPHPHHSDPHHHAGDSHHTGDPHHAGDGHHTGDPHHPGDPHHTDNAEPHHSGDVHHTDDPHHTSDPHHFDDGHHHTGNHHIDPHHHAGPTHHNAGPHHHAGDPHSAHDPMHIVGLSITADRYGNRSLHVHETHLGDVTHDGHIERNDVLHHFGHSNFKHGASLSGELNYVQFADGQNGLILVDTAHLPEDFDLLRALATLTINSTPAPPTGDYNGNGTIDAADYVVWRNTLGSTAHLAADGNRNNRVDAADYDLWRAHFGRTAGSGSGAAVPELSTLVLMLVGMLATYSCRRAAVS